MDNLDRTLSVFADGEPVTGWARAKLLGSEQLGLAPGLFMLTLVNLSEEDYLLLSRAREVTVKHEEVVLLSGFVADVLRSRGKNGTETHAAVSPGLSLWEAVVSLDLEAGASVSETVRRLLEASGTGIPLLAFPGADPAAIRGQAFFGRAAECIEDALSKCGARCCLVPSGLCVIPQEGLPVSITLTEEDLTAPPSLNSGGDMVLQTGPAGWTLGKYAEVRCGEVSGRGVIAERLLNLDTGEGPWRAELIVEMTRDG
jgi:hypothetical protein